MWYFPSYRELKINGHKPTKVPVVQLLTALGKTFSSLIDITLGLLVRVSNGYTSFKINWATNNTFGIFSKKDICN